MLTTELMVPSKGWAETAISDDKVGEKSFSNNGMA